MSAERYKTISDDIIKRIDNGEFKKTDKIPTVRVLVKEYSSSHRTIAKVLECLEYRDVIIRYPGQGCFISHSVIASNEEV